MNKDSSLIWKIILAVVLIVILAVGFYKVNSQKNLNNQPPSSTTSPAVNSASATPTPASTPASLKNQYLQVNLLSGWTAKEVPGNARAIHITKGNYILFINTNATQASGVTGGRFAEIGQGAPSADTVIKSWPADPCSAPITTEESGSSFYTRRADLYTAANTNCTIATNGATAWYFSYFTDSSNRYFNYYTNGQNPALVITMSYQTNDVNALPQKGDPNLDASLEQMTTMVKSLKIAGR